MFSIFTENFYFQAWYCTEGALNRKKNKLKNQEHFWQKIASPNLFYLENKIPLVDCELL